jgi:hypothetical protein
MDALEPSDAGPHRPAFLRLQGTREKLMGDQQPTSDDAAWVKMQIDMAVTKEKVDAVLGDVRGIREDLRNVYATKTELKEVAEDVAGLKNNVSWLVKAILGAVRTAALGLVLVKGGVPH